MIFFGHWLSCFQKEVFRSTLETFNLKTLIPMFPLEKFQFSVKIFSPDLLWMTIWIQNDSLWIQERNGFFFRFASFQLKSSLQTSNTDL